MTTTDDTKYQCISIKRNQTLTGPTLTIITIRKNNNQVYIRSLGPVSYQLFGVVHKSYKSISYPHLKNYKVE